MEDKQPIVSSVIAGMDLQSVASQYKPSSYSYALNAIQEGFDGNSYTLQNEEGSILCTTFPTGYYPVHTHHIIEKSIIIFWLTDGVNSELGKVDTNTCFYSKIINASCLAFNLITSVAESEHKVTSCSTEVYWADGGPRRYIDLDNLPFKLNIEGCDINQSTQVDCNKLLVQPGFSIPQIEIAEVDSDGELEAGTYQFGIQYGNILSEAYTSVYSITNPLPVFDLNKITQDFNYKVNKSIKLNIYNIDISGIYEYYNLIVVKTVNLISTPYLVGTYQITSSQSTASYTGQNKTEIPLSILEVFEKYPYYTNANGVTSAQDVLIWSNVSLKDDISYQKIWNEVNLLWETKKLTSLNTYKDELNSTNSKGYFRDEVYAFEGVFLLKGGYQTSKCHIPGRKSRSSDLEIILNDDTIQNISNCDTTEEGTPKWRQYNTATLLGTSQDATDCNDKPYQWGEFSYYESSEVYPCNENIWGDLAGKQIRHHKFPDSSITHIHDDNYVYPLGIRVDVQQLVDIINSSSLTQDQKNEIVGFKITRANRANNKSIVARGLINNVLKYSTKNNIIDSIQQQPGVSSSQSLIDTTTGLLKNAIDAEGVFNITATVSYTSAYDTIRAARPVDPTDPNFLTLVQSAINFTKIGLYSSNTSQSTVYAQSALEVLNALLETSKSLLSIKASNIIVPNTEDFLYFPNYLFNDVKGNDSFLDNIIKDDSSRSRLTFHSPDTSFYQPSIGNTLKLETAEYGFSSGHIKEVKNHAKYQFVNTRAYITALIAGVGIGFASGTYGLSNNVFNGQAAFISYQAMLDIIYKITPHKNYAFQYNAVGNYSSFKTIDNNGNKQRKIDIGYYLNSGIQSVGDDLNINNYQRESSVYIKTNKPLPYTYEIPGVPEDISNLLIPTLDVVTVPISSFYATIKKSFDNQYGQIYSYESIDTGYQKMIDITKNNYTTESIYGGDCFINKFSYKSKIPFFIDNRVNPVGTNIFANDSDISYNELSNVGKVKYWFSTDVTQKNSVFSTIFGVKSKKFFWERDTFFYDNGMIMLFAYGIPTFFTESEINVDARQAYNSLEGDFYPRVGTGIPDEWLQETNVSINHDNTYFYNKTFSKQNKENNFSALPDNICTTSYPYRAIFSEEQKEITNLRRNNWLIYRPAAKFDFPQNNGRLIGLNGIDNKQVLARFENKSLLYNALLTMPSSTAQVYLGQSLFSQNTPPLDYSDSDLGSVGTQHKLFLKTEFGNIIFDAKRGQVFSLHPAAYMSKPQAKELTNEGVTKFLNDYMPFQINTYFPEINIDNVYNGIGISGVYDSKYNRLIFTKLDYKPIVSGIIYENNKFYFNRTEIQLIDTNYFCNYSFTLSYSFNTNAWVSFHSYYPNYYIGATNKFYAGTIEDGLWKHNDTFTLFNNFFGRKEPYIIEYPIYYKGSEEILQDIKDYSKILRYNNYEEVVETNDIYFSKAIIYNNQQCSGTLVLTKKPKNNLSAYTKYPVYSSDQKEILFTKSNNFYQFNTFWSINKTSDSPMWLKSCGSLSMQKVINNDNMDYRKLSHNKSTIMARDCKIRLINDSTDQYKFISNFLLQETQTSYK